MLLKPSELSPAFSALVAELVPLYLDPHVVRVVNGAIPETTKVNIINRLSGNDLYTIPL